MKAELHATDFPNGVPISLWGRDHITTLLYAECRAVDDKGRLDRRQMREDRAYPTRLRRTEGDEAETHIIGHTDFDCLLDAAAAGLIVPLISGSWEAGEPVTFTDKGWEFVHGLRRARAEGKPSQYGV